MSESFTSVFQEISIQHLNILFLLGLALFSGVIGGRLLQKLKIPKVVGYILIGVILGETGLNIINKGIITTLAPFNYFALGLIGFMVGGELKKKVFAKYGKQLLIILLCEGIAPFLIVSILIGLVGGFVFGDFRLSFAISILFGAIASATDPATTTEVLREYKTRGPLTRTILGIVALDDGLALLLFVIASSIAGILIGDTQTSLISSLILPVYEILGAIIIGTFFGFILCKILKKYSQEARVLAFSIGTILLLVGLSLAIGVDMLLSLMTLGVIVANFKPRRSKDAFKLIESFSPPIYVLFFVLIGAKLNLRQMAPVIFLLVFVYLVGTMLGKIIGSRLGANISNAPKSVRKYLALSMFPQAGVAVGLSILAAQHFPGEIGNTIVIVITATTFISQLLGPALTKFSLTKAKEVGLNITEDDLIDTTIAQDLMDKKPPLLYKNMHLSEILAIFSKSTNLYYPVVDKNNKIIGIITVDSIRNIFMETGLNDLLLAVDLMEPCLTTIEPQSKLALVKEELDNYNIECLAVINQDKTIVGFIEKRRLNRFISTKILELQRQADSLETLS